MSAPAKGRAKPDGGRASELQSKFATFLTPYSDHILQLQSALLLHNVPLFAAICVFLSAFLAASYFLTRSLIYLAVVVPSVQLLSALRFFDFFRALYLSELPNLSDTNPRRVRALDGLLALAAAPIRLGCLGVVYVGRVLRAPNVMDNLIIIMAIVILEFLFQAVDAFVVAAVIIAVALAAPAVLTMTPIVGYAKKYILAWIPRRLRRRKA
jgi:hypothetical protein